VDAAVAALAIVPAAITIASVMRKGLSRFMGEVSGG